jgi:stearoyl-CoA desaturase (delta-9 desaturase)
MDTLAQPASRERWISPRSVPFALVHLVALVGVVLTGWSWKGLAWALALYALRMFFVTAGYHRYFSHRTFKTSRPFQFFLAFMAETSTQKGVLWWASHHRWHHKYSDEPADVHSAKQDGFWWSHVGWILSSRHENADMDRVSDLTRYPELVWINKHMLVPPVLFAVATFLVGGWPGLLWGYFVSTVLLWHGTFTINSLAHLLGRRRYETTDDSRNHWLLALITLGEGWHNNHHHYQSSVNQGFFWWEIDVSYCVLRMLSWVGLVWDLRKPPRELLVNSSPALPAARPARTTA